MQSLQYSNKQNELYSNNHSDHFAISKIAFLFCDTGNGRNWTVLPGQFITYLYIYELVVS